MTARFLSVLGFALITLGSSAQLSADLMGDIIQDVKRRQCWPEPFSGWDRETVRAPFVIQVANGWRRQNMLGEFHFEPNNGQLTEAGRKKVLWILTVCPEQHRLIYVHAAEQNAETLARIASVQQLSSQISPNRPAPVLATTIPDDGWPADEVDAISRKYQSSMPSPRLPAASSGAGSGSSGGGSGMSGQ